jgi:hypothetical protein
VEHRWRLPCGMHRASVRSMEVMLTLAVDSRRKLLLLLQIMRYHFWILDRWLCTF